MTFIIGSILFSLFLFSCMSCFAIEIYRNLQRGVRYRLGQWCFISSSMFCFAFVLSYLSASLGLI